MATLNYLMYIPQEQQEELDYVPRWTQDGTFVSSVPMTKDLVGSYPPVDGTNDWYYILSDSIDENGNLVMYIPSAYEIAGLKEYGIGGWVDTSYGTPGGRNRIDIGSFADPMNASDTYITYTHVYVDAFGEGVVGVEKYAVKLGPASGTPDVQISEGYDSES